MRFSFSALLIGLAVVLISVRTSQAQWVQMNGLCEATVSCGTSTGDVHLMATWGRIYRSADDGVSWTLCSGGLIDTIVVSALGTQKTSSTQSYIFASSTSGGIFRSEDGGLSWSSMNPALSAEAFAANTSYVFASSGHVVYRSSDHGMNWDTVAKGTGPNQRITSMFASDSEICIASYDKLFRSVNNGNTWSDITKTLGGYISSVIRHDTDLFVGNSAGLSRSRDNGATWSSVSLPYSDAGVSAFVTSSADPSVLVAVTGTGIIRSEDNGSTWMQVSSAISHTRPLFAGGHSIFAGISRDAGAIDRSTDLGITWHPASRGLRRQPLGSVLVLGKVVLAGLATNGLRISKDRGESWSVADSGFYDPSYIWGFAKREDSSGRMRVYALTTGVFASSDSGAHWQGVPGTAPGLQNIRSLAVTDSIILVGTAYNGLYFTTNEGREWHSAVFPPSILQRDILSLVAFDSNVFIGTSGWLIHLVADYRSGNFRLVDSPFSAKVREFCYTRSELGHRTLFGTTADGVLRTTDNAASWTLQRDGLTNVSCDAIEAANGRIFVSSNDVSVSTDNGDHWRPTYAPFAGWALSASDGYLYAATGNAGLWRYSLDSPLSVSTVHSYPETPKVTFRDGRLQVSSSEDVVDHVDIYCLTGALVQRLDYARTQSVAGLPPGLYEAVVYSSGRKLAACRFFVR